MKTKTRFIKNFFSLSFADFFSRVFGTILTVVVARMLGAPALGVLAFGAAFVSYFNIVADFGLTSLGIREIAKDKSKTELFSSSVLMVQLFGAALMFMVLMLIALLMHLSRTELIVIVLYGIGLFPFALNMGYVFQAHERMEFITIARVASQVINLVLGLGLLVVTKSVIVLPLATLIGALSESVLVFVLLKKRSLFEFKGINFKVIKGLVIDGIPFFISAFMIQVYTSTGTILLKYFNNLNVVGLFSAGFKIINLVMIISGFMTWALYPMLSYDFTNDIEGFYRKIKLMTRVYLIIGITFSIISFLFASEIVQIIYGSEFAETVILLRLFSLLPGLMYLNSVVGISLIASGNQKITAKSLTYAAVLNVVLNLLFIPRFGFIGSGIAAVLSEVFVCIYLLASQRRVLLVTSVQVWVLKFVPVILVLLVVNMLLEPFNLLVRLFLIALIYGLMVLGLGLVKISEITVIMEPVVRRLRRM